MSRWSLLARLLAGLPGGYGLAVLWSMSWVARYDGARVDAVLIGTISGFAIAAAAAIWAFSPLSLWRILLGFAAAATLLAVLALAGR